jgi:hypothetical protein
LVHPRGLVGVAAYLRNQLRSGIEELSGLMLSLRDGEPALNRTARAWSNGVLTLLGDMRRHPEAFS